MAESSPLDLRAESEFGPAPAQGTLTVSLFQPMGMASRVRFHAEEDRPGRGRRPVSNTLAAP